MKQRNKQSKTKFNSSLKYNFYVQGSASLNIQYPFHSDILIVGSNYCGNVMLRNTVNHLIVFYLQGSFSFVILFSPKRYNTRQGSNGNLKKQHVLSPNASNQWP